MQCNEAREHMTNSLFESQIPKILQLHLKQCRACREFRDAVAAALSPLKQAPRAVPSEAIWQKISGKLDEKMQPVFSFQYLWTVLGDIRNALLDIIPKPVIGGVSVLAIVLVAVVLTRLPHHAMPSTSFMNEQISYLMDLNSEAEDDDLGTAVEIFL